MIATLPGDSGQAGRVSVGVLDGVGVVVKIEERGVEAGLRLRSGLHAEIAQAVTPVQLSLGGHGQQQRQGAGHRAEQYQSSHCRLLNLPNYHLIPRPLERSADEAHTPRRARRGRLPPARRRPSPSGRIRAHRRPGPAAPGWARNGRSAGRSGPSGSPRPDLHGGVDSVEARHGDIGDDHVGRKPGRFVDERAAVPPPKPRRRSPVRSGLRSCSSVSLWSSADRTLGRRGAGRELDTAHS